MEKDNMDNDLSDIMKEIEALEQDFRNEEKAFAKSPIIQELAQLNEELSAPVGKKAEAEDQTFDWLKEDNNKAEPLDVSQAEVFEMKARETAPVSHIPTPTKKVEMKKSTSKMSFNFPEGMPVDVEFNRGDEVISFSWTEEGFHVEVDGGMSFTIPFAQCLKKVS